MTPTSYNLFLNTSATTMLLLLFTITTAVSTTTATVQDMLPDIDAYSGHIHNAAMVRHAICLVPFWELSTNRFQNGTPINYFFGSVLASFIRPLRTLNVV